MTSAKDLLDGHLAGTALAGADLFVDRLQASTTSDSLRSRVSGTALDGLQAAGFLESLIKRDAGGRFAKKFGQAVDEATEDAVGLADGGGALRKFAISPRTGKSVADGACSHSLDCFTPKMQETMLKDLKSTTLGFEDVKGIDGAVKVIETNYDAVFQEAVLDHGGTFPPQSAADFPRSGNWYPAASLNTSELGASLGIADPDRAASVGAALGAVYSPKTEWGLNVTQAHATAKLWRDDHVASADELRAAHKDFAYLSNRQRGTRPGYAEMADRYADNPDQFVADFQGQRIRDLHPLIAATAIQGNFKLNPQVVTDMDLDGNLVPRGKPRLITPDLANATKAMNVIRAGANLDDDAFRAVIDREVGGQSKVRSFYSNIYFPDDPRTPITIDTHMAAAGIGQPVGADHPSVDKAIFTNREGGFGMGKTYPLHEAAVRNLATKYGVPPRQMQSMIWQRQVDAYGNTVKTKLVSDNGPLIDLVAERNGAVAAGVATRRLAKLTTARADVGRGGGEGSTQRKREAQSAIDAAVAEIRSGIRRPRRPRPAN